MRKIILLSLLGAGGAIALSATPSLGIPYKGATTYKVTSNGVTTIYISDTPNGSATVDLGLVDRLSSRVAGTCGEVVLSATTVGGGLTSIQANGTTVNLSTLPTQLLPTCTNGTFVETRSTNFKTPDGRIALVGFTANSAVQLNIPKQTTRAVRINACGFGLLRGTSSVALPATFKVGTTSYTLAGLPDAGNPPRCNNGVGYSPTSWSQ